MINDPDFKTGWSKGSANWTSGEAEELVSRPSAYLRILTGAAGDGHENPSFNASEYAGFVAAVTFLVQQRSPQFDLRREVLADIQARLDRGVGPGRGGVIGREAHFLVMTKSAILKGAEIARLLPCKTEFNLELEDFNGPHRPKTLPE